MCFVIKKWTGKLNFFSKRMEDIQQKRQNQIFRIERRASTKLPPLVASLDISIRKALRSVLGLPTVMILKRVSHNISFKAKNLQHARSKMEKK